MQNVIKTKKVFNVASVCLSKIIKGEVDMQVFLCC